MSRYSNQTYQILCCHIPMLTGDQPWLIVPCWTAQTESRSRRPVFLTLPFFLPILSGGAWQCSQSSQFSRTQWNSKSTRLSSHQPWGSRKQRGDRPPIERLAQITTVLTSPQGHQWVPTILYLGVPSALPFLHTLITFPQGSASTAVNQDRFKLGEGSRVSAWTQKVQKQVVLRPHLNHPNPSAPPSSKTPTGATVCFHFLISPPFKCVGFWENTKTSI
jgi:hypothetical protein